MLVYFHTPKGELHTWLSQESYPSWKNKLAAHEDLGSIHSQANVVILKSRVDTSQGSGSLVVLASRLVR